MRRIAAALLCVAVMGAGSSHAAPQRIASLDSCADQYVLALAERSSVVALSPRADDADSWMRERARGLPLRRPTLETLSAVHPDLVVRYWGGDPRMLRALQTRGARVVQIEEAVDFAGVRANIRSVASALERPAAGEALIRDMDGRLARARGAWKRKGALYLTPSGFTAGKGTLIDAMLSAAGLTNLFSKPGYAPVPLEKLVLDPPSLFVLGFFDAARGDRWGSGRHPIVRRAARERTIRSLPAAMLGCPAWPQAEGARILAEAASR